MFLFPVKFWVTLKDLKLDSLPLTIFKLLTKIQNLSKIS